MALTDQTCVPCQGGIPPLTKDQIQPYLSQINSSWQVIDNTQLTRDFSFKNFTQAIKFINQVADIAEKENHHPNIHLTNWNQVQLELYTHKINGLHQNDFILAAKINQIIL